VFDPWVGNIPWRREKDKIPEEEISEVEIDN